MNKIDAAGDFPKTRGSYSGIYCDDVKIVITSLESSIKIKQINAETSGNNRKLLAQYVDNALDNGSNMDCLF